MSSSVKRKGPKAGRKGVTRRDDSPSARRPGPPKRSKPDAASPSPRRAPSAAATPEDRLDRSRLALDAYVRTKFELSWGKARSLIETGKVFVDGEAVLVATTYVRGGSEVELRMSARRPRPETDLADDAIVFVDGHVVVVKKPAGISTIPFDEDEEGTLDARVRAYLARKTKGDPRSAGRPSLGIVHRIDKETSGLVVFTRTWLAKEKLSSQFRAHTVHRRYLAIVHGAPKDATIETHLVADRGDGLRGSLEALNARGRHRPNEKGERAVTHVRVIERLGPATLVECRLETGKTHQIRIHLSESGHPLVGERVYIRQFAGTPIPAPRLMLHATELGFVHPATSEDVRFTEALPSDMEAVAARLRAPSPAPRSNVRK